MKTQETQEEREARKAYHREWARKNPDKVKAAQRRFYKRLAEKQKGGGADDS